MKSKEPVKMYLYTGKLSTLADAFAEVERRNIAEMERREKCQRDGSSVPTKKKSKLKNV